MKKLILAGACAAALAVPLPASAQTIDATTIINVVRGIYDATRGGAFNNGYNPGNTYTPNYNPANSLSSPLDVIFSNLSQGSAVPSHFTLSGYTSPYNQVDLRVQPREQRSQGYRSNIAADASGRFAVNVDASQVPYNGTLSIRAQARDSSGNLGPVRLLEVVRR